MVNGEGVGESKSAKIIELMSRIHKCSWFSLGSHPSLRRTAVVGLQNRCWARESETDIDVCLVCLGGWVCVCVRLVNLLFPLIDIAHTEYPCGRLIQPREMSS